MDSEENNTESSEGEAALEALREEMGADQFIFPIFYALYKTVSGKDSTGSSKTTIEDVEGFKKYLLGGGKNWKAISQGALRFFQNLKSKGASFNAADGSELGEGWFVDGCNQIKSWVERNGGVTESGGCYVATAVYGSYDCPQVWTLRRFRDQVLQASLPGRAFIRAYYAISPALVRSFGKAAWFTRLIRPRLDRLVKKLNQEGIDDGVYTD